MASFTDISGKGKCKYMYTEDRDSEVKLLKDMWTEKDVLCPKCNRGILVHLHKKAKKSNCDWKCPECGEIYRTINMLKKLPED